MDTFGNISDLKTFDNLSMDELIIGVMDMQTMTLSKQSFLSSKSATFRYDPALYSIELNVGSITPVGTETCLVNCRYNNDQKSASNYLRPVVTLNSDTNFEKVSEGVWNIK